MEISEPKFYVVDHLEDILPEWSRWEYHQMMKYLTPSSSKLVITNCGLTETNKNEKEKKQSQIYWADVANDNKTIFNDKAIIIQEPIKDCVQPDNAIKFNDKAFPVERVCLLDMRGEKTLSPEDKNEFDVFVFGGILGDHPPKDRTGVLRQQGFKTRNLLDIQMSTDTALLTTKLIIENGKKISEIPFIDEPEFVKLSSKDYEESFQMEGFRYISDEIDYTTGEIKKKLKGAPLGNPNIYNRLIFVELSMDNMFSEMRN